MRRTADKVLNHSRIITHMAHILSDHIQDLALSRDVATGDSRKSGLSGSEQRDGCEG